MKILAPRANSTKFCTHNRWAPRWLEMQKLGACVWGAGGGVQWWWFGWSCGGGSLGGVAPWLTRGPPKAGLTAGILYKIEDFYYIYLFIYF